VAVDAVGTIAVVQQVAELLIVPADNIDRIHIDRARWLCGVAPMHASPVPTTRHRLDRGGHRHANAALGPPVSPPLQQGRPAT
jgi:transposase